MRDHYSGTPIPTRAERVGLMISLVAFSGYTLFPTKEMKDAKELDIRTAQAIERAKRLGTLDKIDRRIQYSGPERARPEALLESVNALWPHLRGVQSDVGKIQRRILNLQLRNGIIVAVLTALLARAPEIYAWLARFF